MSEVTIKQVDEMLAKLHSLEDDKEAIELALTEKNKEISALSGKLSEVLDSLERTEYTSPFGKVSFEEVFQVKNPPDEKKHLLWDWMRERGIFDKYATVHATALKSLFKAERANAIDSGEDPMTFALPGMDPATIFRRIKFKPNKKGIKDGTSS